MRYLMETPSGVFYFRMKIPKDVKKLLDRELNRNNLELKRSLKTSNRRQAEKMAFQLASQAEDYFTSIRRKAMTLPLFSSFKLDIVQHPNGILKSCCFDIDSERLEAEKEACKFALEQFAVLQSSVPLTTQPIALPEIVPVAPASKSLKLSQAIENFLREKQTLEPKSFYYKNDVPKHLGLMQRILGDIAVDTVDRNAAISYFSTIKQLPKNLNKNPALLGKSISQILALKLPPREASTVNGAMVAASSLWCWLKKYNHTDQDYFDGLRMPRKVGGRDRFTLQELGVLFNHEIFTAHKYDYDWQFWMPIIGAYTGMRMNEILQLRPSDIRTEDGVLVMTVTEDNSDMSVKSAAGIRTVPVHPKLIELGFQRFLKQRKTSPWLFIDGLRIAGDGRRSAAASKWFSRFRDKIGFGKGKDFHSLRHTVIDELKQADAKLYVVKSLVGHSSDLPQSDLTMHVYGKDYAMTKKVETLGLLQYGASTQNILPWNKSKTDTLLADVQLPADESTARLATVFGKSAEAAGLN